MGKSLLANLRLILKFACLPAGRDFDIWQLLSHFKIRPNLPFTRGGQGVPPLKKERCKRIVPRERAGKDVGEVSHRHLFSSTTYNEKQ
jgi:hypothetical protein